MLTVLLPGVTALLTCATFTALARGDGRLGPSEPTGASFGSALVALAATSVVLFRGPRDYPQIEILAGALVVSTWTDLRVGLILDRVTGPALLLVTIFCALEGAVADSILGIVGSAGVVLALHAATRGRGIGLGDAKMAAVIGAALGAYGGGLALACAFVIAALVNSALLLMHRVALGQRVAFGPYLAWGSVVAIALGAAR